MANTLRIKRRASGAAGAPTSLQNAELAFNEVDDTLYYGKGTGGADGSATTVEAIGGKGAVVMLTGEQTISGAKTFTGAVTVPAPTADGHAVTKAYADSLSPNILAGSGVSVTPGTGQITVAVDETVARLASPAFTGNPTAPTQLASDNSTRIATTAFVKSQGYLTTAPVSSVAGRTGAVVLTKGDVGLGSVDNTSDADKPVSTAQQTALNLKANLASPALTGTPTAPTAVAGTNTTQIATTAFVQVAVANLVDAAPGALDTLNELAAALGDDPNFATTITTSLGEKLAKAANLSDLSDVATARTNLGLGSMALQSASAVVISGGSISGITLDTTVIDGGTF